MKRIILGLATIARNVIIFVSMVWIIFSMYKAIILN